MRGETIWLNLAQWLPWRLVYWTGIRLTAHVSALPSFAERAVDSIGALEAVRAWHEVEGGRSGRKMGAALNKLATAERPRERPAVKPPGREHDFDAAAWARAFIEQAGSTPEMAHDEGAMLGWFMGALSAGYREGVREGMRAPVTVTVNGMDAQSVIEHSEEIAAAVVNCLNCENCGKTMHVGPCRAAAGAVAVESARPVASGAACWSAPAVVRPCVNCGGGGVVGAGLCAGCGGAGNVMVAE